MYFCTFIFPELLHNCLEKCYNFRNSCSVYWLRRVWELGFRLLWGRRFRWGFQRHPSVHLIFIPVEVSGSVRAPRPA